jgi:poly-gamma-glutamate capsule biosynthesis protein CapA/YwtB (metallophosphatase superfamily)
MVNAVERADRLADIVIVVIHWGVELHPEPNASG